MASRRKASVEALLLAGLLVAGVWSSSPELLLLALPLVLHLTIGLTLSPGDLANIRLEYEVAPARIVEGEPLDVRLTLHTDEQRSAIVLTEDTSELAQFARPGRARSIGVVRDAEPLELVYSAQPARGLYEGSNIRVEIANGLGFNSWSDHIMCDQLAVVLPRFEQLANIAFKPRRSLVRPGTVRARLGGMGLEFFKSHAYVPGDDVRRLNWKALARWDRLVINEYEEERAADVFVVLDVRTSAYESQRDPKGLFDVTVRGAAGIADYAIRQGHSVGLFLYGERLDWIVPGSGRRHAERLLGALARAQPGVSQAFADLAHIPARFLSRGCQLVFVSPLLAGDADALAALRGRGYAIMALIPDPLTAETGWGAEELSQSTARRILALQRRVLLRDLSLAGVRPLVWNVQAPLAPQAKAAWRRAW